MSPAPPETVPVLVTGAGGYIGSRLMETMAAEGRQGFGAIVALDFRETPPERRMPRVHYVTADIRSPELAAVFMEYRPRVVVHLASIVTPGKKADRAFEYSVDVEGTENVLKSCLEAGVEKIIVTSSGAAYGYHPDNPEWISESDPLRGNRVF
jgi:UDP-glucose 4-epimerase